ncbi:MAG: hypothetical protein ACLPH3_22405 [Terracidiphilus sp.]
MNPLQTKKRSGALRPPAHRAETDAHVALWRAIREGRLATITKTVAQVLGRPPIAFDQWLTENIAAFR